MDNPGRAAGGSGGKIVLLNQQCAFAGARAFTRNGDAVDSTTHYKDIKGLTGKGSAVIAVIRHFV